MSLTATPSPSIAPGKALEYGIATVFQDLALCENLDVVANLFLGHEISPFQLDEVAMEVKAWTLLQELAARIPSVRDRWHRFRRPAADRRHRPFAAAEP